MAITLDADLGTFVQASASGTVSLTTTNAVSAGGFIVIGIVAFDIAATLTGVAGGGLTWTIDKQGRPPSGGGNPVAEFVAIASAQAPDGLAASTVITATWSDTTVQARIIGGTSFLGVATSSPVDGTPTGPTFTDTQVAPWATASYAIQSGSLLYSVCFGESTDTGSTPTSPTLEAWQQVDLANDYGGVANYRIETHADAYTLEGTWGAITKWTNVAVAYRAAGMPDSVHFNGSGARRTFSQGSFAGTGAISAAVIAKLSGTGPSTYKYLFEFLVTGSPVCMPLGWLESGADHALVAWDGTNERSANPTLFLGTDEWYLCGISKATGTATPRYHLYRYSTSTWEHGDFSGTMSFPSFNQVGWPHSGGEPWVGNLLIGAVWDSELADTAFETLELDKASWTAAAPDEAYRFDTAGTITPFIGSGTQFDSGIDTLDVGDAPAGWDDGATYEGTFGGAEGGAFSDTLTWTTTQTINAGEHVVVTSVAITASITSITVGSLSLSEDVEQDTLRVWSAPATEEITSGATVTITLASETSNKAAVGDILSGIATSSYVRDTATNTAFGSSAATGTTDGTPELGDIAWGVVASTSDTVNINSVASPYTLGGDDGTNPWGFGVPIGAVQGAYEVLDAGGAANTTFTLSTSNDYAAAIVVYKAFAEEEGYPAGSAAWVTTL